MRYANEVVMLWYMACCTFIVLSTTDSMVYIAFIGLHVFVLAYYKWAEEREHVKTIRSESV